MKRVKSGISNIDRVHNVIGLPAVRRVRSRAWGRRIRCENTLAAVVCVVARASCRFSNRLPVPQRPVRHNEALQHVVVCRARSPSRITHVAQKWFHFNFLFLILKYVENSVIKFN